VTESNIASGTAYKRVDSQVCCTLTRFCLSSALYLPLFLWLFHRVRKRALAKVPGLLRSEFLIESPRVWYNLSIWENDNAILEFNKLAIHIHAANWSFAYIERKALNRLELWSTEWSLFAVSTNLNWDSLDLNKIIAAERSRFSKPGRCKGAL
jgi:hypothetical protein